MVLKLVDTRIVNNSKVEVYIGTYLGTPVDIAKIYKRSSVVHNFKLFAETYKWMYSSMPFQTFVKLKIDFKLQMKELSKSDPVEYYRFMTELDQNERNSKSMSEVKKFCDEFNKIVSQ